MVLKVILERDEELEEQTIKVICPYYPEEKDEYWWVVVGDKKTNKILATKRTLFKNKSIVDLTF